MVYHIPVLLNESIDGLIKDPNGVYLDLTFGGGGHSREILSRLGKNGRLIGFDQDLDAQAESDHIIDNRFLFIRSNFRYFRNFLRYHKIEKVDGIIADLGISSHHINNPERGFSYKADSKIDMRMNRDGDESAVEILNNRSRENLIAIFREYGEINNAGKLAGKIIKTRTEEKPFYDIPGLVKAISDCIPPRQENKYLAKVFQALRIEVNGEIEVLKHMLLQVLLSLKPGGRLVIISYHSLEDRIVKNFMKSGKPEGGVEKDFFGNPLVPFDMVYRKAIVPSDNELEANSRSRSARLRIAQRN